MKKPGSEFWQSENHADKKSALPKSTTGKVLVILGQTATGKSNLAVKIAKQIGGEIISADSRQVYKGLDLGTGKITKKEMEGVPHHLLNVANPRKSFSVAEYKKLAEEKIEEILKRGKTPIIAGGTGLYIKSIVDNISFPEVPPNETLRKKLKKSSAKKLFALLKKIDPRRAQTIESKNPRRLIRAIEIAKALGRVPNLEASLPSKYKILQIGLKLPPEVLKKKIKERLKKRLRAGMAIELHNLRKKGVPWKRFRELGFDQKYIALYLQNKISQKEMLEKLLNKNWQYAKRQWTWFKRDKKIIWIDPTRKSDLKKLEIEIKKFKGGFDRNFSYIVYDTESKKSIVVDPIIKEEIPSFIEENKLDLAYVLNTHGHFDHVEGNGKILDLTGAKLFDPAKKNEKVGPISIKVIPTPGHTKDSVCYLINKKWLPL